MSKLAKNMMNPALDCILAFGPPEALFVTLRGKFVPLHRARCLTFDWNKWTVVSVGSRRCFFGGKTPFDVAMSRLCGAGFVPVLNQTLAGRDQICDILWEAAPGQVFTWPAELGGKLVRSIVFVPLGPADREVAKAVVETGGFTARTADHKPFLVKVEGDTVVAAVKFRIWSFQWEAIVQADDQHLAETVRLLVSSWLCGLKKPVKVEKKEGLKGLGETLGMTYKVEEQRLVVKPTGGNLEVAESELSGVRPVPVGPPASILGRVRERLEKASGAGWLGRFRVMVGGEGPFHLSVKVPWWAKPSFVSAFLAELRSQGYRPAERISWTEMAWVDPDAVTFLDSQLVAVEGVSDGKIVASREAYLLAEGRPGTQVSISSSRISFSGDRRRAALFLETAKAVEEKLGGSLGLSVSASGEARALATMLSQVFLEA